MLLSDLIHLPAEALHLTSASDSVRKDLLQAVPACLPDGKRDLVAMGDAVTAVEAYRSDHPRAVKSSRPAWVLTGDSLLRYPERCEGFALRGRRAEVEDNVGGDCTLVYETQADAQAELAWWYPAFGKVWTVAQCGQAPARAVAKSVLAGDRDALAVLADALEEQGADPLAEVVRGMAAPQPIDSEGRLLFPFDSPCPGILVTPGSKRAWEALKEDISFSLLAGSREMVTTGDCIDEFHTFRKKHSPALKGWRKIWVLSDAELMTRPYADALRGRPLQDGGGSDYQVVYDSREEAMTELALWHAVAGNVWTVWQCGPEAARDEARAVLDGQRENLDDLAGALAKHKARTLAEAMRTLRQPARPASGKKRRRSAR
jgi:hypothetical protein